MRGIFSVDTSAWLPQSSSWPQSKLASPSPRFLWVLGQDGKGKAPAHSGPRGFGADACQFP